MESNSQVGGSSLCNIATDSMLMMMSAVYIGHVRLSVIETPMYLLLSVVSSILLWMAYDVSRANLGLFAITLMAVHFLGLNSNCQSFYHCSSDDRYNRTTCWSMSVVMLLNRRQSSVNSLVREECMTSGRSLMYERQRRGSRMVHWGTSDVTFA